MRPLSIPSAIVCLLLSGSHSARSGPAAGKNMPWVASWATSVYVPEDANLLPTEDLRNATLRQMVHLSVGGSRLRVRVSNAMGTAPLQLTSVHIAHPLARNAAAIDPASDVVLSFNGSAEAMIPSGAEYVSDPVVFPAAALSDLAITIHFADPPVQQTGHPGSRATSYVVHGDMVSAADLPDAKKVDHWYQIAAVEVQAHVGTVVALGDSITDGHGAIPNENTRWTDVLAQRLSGRMGIVNEGIGGNHMLTDGLGPSALARFDRDVLAVAGVRTVILLEGVNDLGGLTIAHEVSAAEHQAFVARILGSYQQVIERAHAQGILALGATITPYVGSAYYHPGSASEADRQAINAWIRARGHFDGVVDFDQVTRDPAHPERLLPALDSGDHLHPSPAGYKVMGEAVPLQLLQAK